MTSLHQLLTSLDMPTETKYISMTPKSTKLKHKKNHKLNLGLVCDDMLYYYKPSALNMKMLLVSNNTSYSTLMRNWMLLNINKK